jgi:hypothetical protein
MAFSASPWYARYAQMGMAPFGLSAVEDQQLAGLLMWVPGGTGTCRRGPGADRPALRDRPTTEPPMRASLVLLCLVGLAVVAIGLACRRAFSNDSARPGAKPPP